MTQIKKIKAEIERRYDSNMEAAASISEGTISHSLFMAAAKEDYDLLAYIEEHINIKED